MAKITKVPNGPLIKKKGPYAGSTLKNGGTTTTKTTLDPKSRELIINQSKENQKKKDSTYESNTKINLEKSIKDLALKAQQKKLEERTLKLYENKKLKLPIQKNGGPIKKAKGGAMIKRADGSFSKRGLWDNIRANKGSGKKPTKQMLVQEKKIKAKSKK
jgi:hypothetical protein